MSSLDRNLPVVIAEHTPNPDCIRLSAHPERDSSVHAGRAFDRPGDAVGVSSVAERLLRVPGVKSVFVDASFVAVTRDPSVPWEQLGDRLVAEVREAATSGEVWLVPDAGDAIAATDEIEGAIREVLDRDIRPAVRRDGGEVAFVDFSGGVVRLELRGSCAGCPASARTLRDGIERRLREVIPQVRSVVADG